MARAQPPRGGEELLAPFRVLAGGEDLATAGAALLERACQALAAVEGVVLLLVALGLGAGTSVKELAGMCEAFGGGRSGTS